jgi:hypothetical protein
MPSLQDFLREMYAKYQPGVDPEPGRLGRGDGAVDVPNRPGFSYVTSLDGSGTVSEVLNYRVSSDKWGQLVITGYHPTEYVTRRQIISVWDAYTVAVPMDVMPHSHTWTNPPTNMTSWVRTEQILQGLAVPVAGELSLDIWPKDYILINGWKRNTNTTRVDISGSIPTSFGVRATLLVVDGSTGQFALRDGPVVANINLLQDSDLPDPLPGDSVEWMIVCRYGATEFTYDDLFDRRFSTSTAADYIPHSLATAVNDFLVASGAGRFVKKTLSEVVTILRTVLDGIYQAVGPYLTEETDPIFTASEAANFEAGDKSKLDGIEAGAEVNNISDPDAAELTGGGKTALHSHGKYCQYVYAIVGGEFTFIKDSDGFPVMAYFDLE